MGLGWFTLIYGMKYFCNYFIITSNKVISLFFWSFPPQFSTKEIKGGLQCFTNNVLLFEGGDFEIVLYIDYSNRLIEEIHQTQYWKLHLVAYVGRMGLL